MRSNNTNIHIRKGTSNGIRKKMKKYVKKKFKNIIPLEEELLTGQFPLESESLTGQGSKI